MVMQTKIRGIIYKAELPSGKAYIGQTINSFTKRKANHKWDARCGSSYPFHRAIRKYGAENIKWKIIARADNIAALNAAEIAAIAEHSTLSPDGYNMRAGGESGGAHTAEVRAKISAKAKARFAAMTDEEKAEWSAKMHAPPRAKKGVPKSAETRAKMSAAAKIRCTPEWRAKIRAKLRAANLGKTRSAEHRAKIAAAVKARWAAMSENEKAAARAKTAAAMKEAMNRPEAKAKISAATRARLAAMSDEKKAEWSARMHKARWAA